MRIDFIVDGRPLPQPKPSSVGARRFYKKSYLDWRHEVEVAASVAALELEQRGEPWDAHHDAYAVRLRFMQPDRRRTDIDRLEATILDALTRAGIWEDDRLVCSLKATRGYSPRPRVEVVVEHTSIEVEL